MVGEEVFVASALHSITMIGVFMILYLKSEDNTIMKNVWLTGIFLILTYAMLVEEKAFSVTGLAALSSMALTVYTILIQVIELLGIVFFLKLLFGIISALWLTLFGKKEPPLLKEQEYIRY